MFNLQNNAVLIGNVFSRNNSRDISDELSLEETYYEIASDIRNHINSSSVDKRVIAISANYHPKVWEAISATAPGTKQTVYNNMQLFNQIVISLVKPSSSLVLIPDQYMLTVAALNHIGSSLTFVNDQSLYNFENFVLENSQYPFNSTYNVVDYQDLIDENFSEKFDFIFAGAISFNSDIDLLYSLVDSLNSGGCLLIGNTSNMSEVYYSQISINVGTYLHRAINSIENVYTYHIPFGIGFDIIVKK